MRTNNILKRTIALIGLGLAACLPSLAQDQSENHLSVKTMLDAEGTNGVNTVQYYDGLGRPHQRMKTEFTGMLGHNPLHDERQYDLSGRPCINLLPVPGSNRPGNLLASQREAMDFYDDNRPYTETVYQPSPLGRVAEVRGAGEAWEGHARTFQYLQNDASDTLRCNRYSVGADGKPVKEGLYADNMLQVVRETDEDGHVAYTFTDMQGRTMLERRMNEGVAHDTYYIYDLYGQLRYVLPPMCGGECGDDVLEKYAYQYKYDERGNVVEKKLPGAYPVKYTYDEAGHLTYSQSGNQAMEHTVYLYDQHGRLAVQGKYRPKFNIGDGPKSVLPELEGETWYCIPLWHSGASMALGTRYADIGYLLTYYVPFSINPGIGLATRSGIIGGGDWEITIQPDKKFDPEFQLVNYYDDYGFMDLEGFKDKAYFTAPATNGRGQLTGNMTATTDGKTKLYSVYHYDKYGREVKRVEENALGGYDVTETSYTFTGKPLVVTHTHNVPGKSTLTEKYTYSYDTGDRVKEIKHSLDGKADVVLASYTYDEFGRMKDKQLHGGTAQQVGYSYNLRGWLTGIDGEKFTQSLYYNTGNGTPTYNGNISSMTWKAGDETAVRGYKFTYDALDRLKNAAYGEGTALSSNTGRFSENVTNYDLNGNITGLQRYGQTSASAYGVVDNLTFTLNGNQLNRVDDTATGGLFEDAVQQSGEYAYDRNGNMTKDLNRNISGITYNSLNLPSKATFTDGSTIAYTYMVDGTKLKTVRTIGDATTTTDYCGNAVYENGTLKFLLTDEGYITPDDGKYHYYLTDHLGNNRVIVGQTGNVEEVNHYYPFGGMFASTDVQPYKYNGKEWDEKAKWYDYGARNYDATLGRFTTNDRFAEKYVALSPYQYAANNPIRNIDVNGDSISIKGADLPELVEAILAGLEDGSSVTMKWKDGVLDPSSIKEQAMDSDDFFLKDLYEIASSNKMVEISLSDKNTYMMDGKIVSEDFYPPVDYNTKEYGEEYENLLRLGNDIVGKTFDGNLGQTLVPGKRAASGKSSLNSNIQIIINKKGNLNHRVVGLAHEFAHVILYLKGLPFGHTQPGVDAFVYGRNNEMMRRLGYGQ